MSAATISSSTDCKPFSKADDAIVLYLAYWSSLDYGA